MAYAACEMTSDQEVVEYPFEHPTYCLFDHEFLEKRLR